MKPTLIDTSIAVPLLLANHPDHAQVMAWARGRKLTFAGHSLFETYAVLTRLPIDSRLTATQAQQLIAQYGESERLAVSDQEAIRLMSALNITGGQVYDALVAMASNGKKFASRDQRAHDVYSKLGVDIEMI